MERKSVRNTRFGEKTIDTDCDSGGDKWHLILALLKYSRILTLEGEEKEYFKTKIVVEIFELDSAVLVWEEKKGIFVFDSREFHRKTLASN